jgi:hypothetical protein
MCENTEGYKTIAKNDEFLSYSKNRKYFSFKYNLKLLYNKVN